MVFSVKWLKAGDSIGRLALMDVVVDRKGRITVAGWYANRVKEGEELRQNEWSNQMEWLAQFEEDGTLRWFSD